MISHREEALRAIQSAIAMLDEVPIEGLHGHLLLSTLRYAADEIEQIQEVKRVRKAKETALVEQAKKT